MRDQISLRMQGATDLLLFIIMSVYSVPIILADNSTFILTIFALALIKVRCIRRIRLLRFHLYLVMLLISIFSLFLTALLYTDSAGQESELIYQFFIIKIFEANLSHAIFLSIRLFCLMGISYVFISIVNPEALVYAVLQNTRLPANIGYSILAALQSLLHFRHNYAKINVMYTIRFRKKMNPLRAIIPLLVDASKYAFQVGLSLESRGLHNKKTYIEEIRWTFRETLILIITLAEIVGLYFLFRHLTEIQVLLY